MATDSIAASAEVSELVRQKEKVSGMEKEHFKGIPLSQSDEIEIASNTEKIMSQLRNVDIYSEDIVTNDGLSSALRDIFKEASDRKGQVASLTNSFTKRNFQGMEDSSSHSALHEMQQILDEYNPKEYKLNQPEKILGFLPVPDSIKSKMMKYARKFKAAETRINEVILGIMKSRDEGLVSVKELEQVQKQLQQLSKQLTVQYKTFKSLADQIDPYIEELRDRDSLKAEKIEREIRSVLYQNMIDTLEILNYTKLGFTQVGILKETQNTLNTQMDRLANSGMVILQINQTISVSLFKQQQQGEIVDNIQKTMTSLTESAAKGISDHAKHVKELSEKPMQSVETIQAAFDSTINAVKDLDTARANSVSRAKAAIESLEKQNDVMTNEIDKTRLAAEAMKDLATKASQPKPASKMTF